MNSKKVVKSNLDLEQYHKMLEVHLRENISISDIIREGINLKLESYGG